MSKFSFILTSEYDVYETDDDGEKVHRGKIIIDSSGLHYDAPAYLNLECMQAIVKYMADLQLTLEGEV